jgi:hypothetical protein
MNNSYNGKVYTIEEDNSCKFDWLAFGIWIFSLVVSLLPIYLLLLSHLKQSGTIDVNFAFKCFVTEDTIWVFSTVLLFTLANCFVQSIRKRKTRPWAVFLMLFGTFVFIVSEITWVYFKSNMTVESVIIWPIWVSIILIVVSLVISTPLQINFIKGEN